MYRKREKKKQKANQRKERKEEKKERMGIEWLVVDCHWNNVEYVWPGISYGKRGWKDRCFSFEMVHCYLP